MKKTITLFSIFVISLTGFAQNSWPEPGAKWYYDYFSVSASGYILLYSDHQIIKNGILCDVFTEEIYYSTLGPMGNIIQGSSITLDAFYTFSRNDSVFYLNEEENHFYLLYDFNAVVGDRWNTGSPTPICEDSLGVVTIDSSGTTTINGFPLKWTYAALDSNSSFGHHGRIMERIGGVGTYMFPQILACIADAAEGGSLRCYEDPAFGLYKTGTTDCNYLITGIEKRASLQGSKIYPTPVQDELHIDLVKQQQLPASVRIFSLEGRLLKTKQLPALKNTLDLGGIENDWLLIEISSADGQKIHQKIVRSGK